MAPTPKVSRLLHKLLVPVVFVMGVAMFLSVFGQVIFRYLLNEPLSWSEEFARYMMVWIGCVAAAEAYAIGSHVGVNALVDNLPPTLKKWSKLTAHLAVAILMVVVIFQGFKLSYLLKDQTSPALGIPMTWPYLAVPVGGALILIQALGIFFHELKQPPTSATNVCSPNEV